METTVETSVAPTQVVFLQDDIDPTTNACGGSFHQTYIASADYPSGMNASYFTDLTSGSPMKLGYICTNSSDYPSINGLALSPDRTQIALQQVWDYETVLDYSVATERTTAIKQSSVNCYNPKFSPNGSYISCVDPPGVVQLVSASNPQTIDHSYTLPQGFQIYQTPGFEAYQWLPDGSGIVFTSAIGQASSNIFPCPLGNTWIDPNGIYRFSFATGKVTPIVAPSCSNPITQISGITVSPEGQIAYWGNQLTLSSGGDFIDTPEMLRVINVDGTDDHAVSVKFAYSAFLDGFCSESIQGASWEEGDKALIVSVFTQVGIANGCDPNASYYGRIERIDVSSGARSVVLDEHAQGYSLFSPSTATLGDIIPPALTVAHTVDGQNGWNVSSPVTETVTASDSGSGLAAGSPFCTLDGTPVVLSPTSASTWEFAVTSDGRRQISCTAIDDAGNQASAGDSVNIDTTPPSISASASPAPDADGWNNTPVRVSFICSDVVSGIASCPTPVAAGEGVGQTITGEATDSAGNTATATLGDINVDLTPPSVTYTGNAGIYTVDQTVAITCSAVDALSGVQTSTCHDITGPAWAFGLGTTSFSASALDVAGNVGTGSTSFTVAVSESSLDGLIRQFFGGDKNSGNGLIAKVSAVVTASSSAEKAEAIKAFDNQVDAKVGKPLSKDQAALLEAFIAGL